MSRFTLVHLANGRLAICDNDCNALLAVPTMHDDLPRETRISVLEYVLCRQIGMAELIARAGRRSTDQRDQDRRAISLSMISERPYSADLDHGLAA